MSTVVVIPQTPQTVAASILGREVTKAQIEAVLTGEIISHFHPNKLKYRYYVGEQGDFATVPLAIAWLEANMLGNSELLIDSGDYDISDTVAIDLPYHLSIRGFDSNSAFINSATGLTGKSMFQITSSVYFERICFDGSTLANYGTLSTENCIEILGTNYHEITAFLIKNFYDGIKLIGAGSLWVFNSVMENIVGQGIRVSSTGATSIDVETNTFINCANSIGLMKSTAGEWNIINNIFTNSAGQTAILYDPANYIYTDDPVGAGNTWNNIGTFSSGFDYSRADGRDANIYIRGNSGREDKMPHFKVNVINNTSPTTVTTAGTFYKAVFTNGATYTCKWTLGNNKYTYQPQNRSDVPVWIAGVVSTNGTNKNVDIAIRKHGIATQISPVTVRCAVASQPYSFGLIAYAQDMGAGDYIEIFLTSSTNGDLVTIQDLTLYADAK